MAPLFTFFEEASSTVVLVILLGVIFIGIPFVMLAFNVIRRLHEMHKLMKPVGTLFVTDEREIYLELDDSTIIDKPYGTVVLRVSKAGTKK